MIAIRNMSLRNSVLAGLALLGTAASFTATTQPVHAASSQVFYTATLAAPLAAPQQQILRGVLWNCEGTTCTAAKDTSRDVNVCARLSRRVGQVAAFATPKGSLAAEDLTRCNAADS